MNSPPISSSTSSPPELSAWLKPRSRWLVWPALILAMLFSFGAGAGLALNNASAETRTEFVELKAKREQKTESKKVARTWKVTIEPSGKRTEEGAERELTKAETVTAETSLSTARTTVTELTKPGWRVGVQAGATWKEPALQLTGPLVIGVSVEARLARTPVSVGAWGSTFGAAGASLSVEF